MLSFLLTLLSKNLYVRVQQLQIQQNSFFYKNNTGGFLDSQECLKIIIKTDEYNSRPKYDYSKIKP